MGNSRITERIYLQRTNITRQHHEVLRATRKHVPRVEIQKAHQKVNAHRASHRDDQIRKEIISQREIGFLYPDPARKALDYDISCAERGIRHYDSVRDHGGQEHPPSALRPVPHAHDELCTDEEDAEKPEKGEYAATPTVTEGVEFPVC